MVHDYSLFILLISTPLVLFIAHAAIIRIAARVHAPVSNQKVALYTIVLMNIPIICSSIRIIGFFNATKADYAYVLCAYNLIGYCYFHLFNMSETARRIKILSAVKKGAIASLKDVQGHYDYHTTLMLRLERLEALSQIALSNGKYNVTGGTLLVAANCIRFLRNILGFK